MYVNGAISEPYNRTCPQVFKHSPFFQSIQDMLEDYKKNRLGNVRKLPEPLLVYLRTMESESEAWWNHWKAELPEMKS